MSFIMSHVLLFFSLDALFLSFSFLKIEEKKEHIAHKNI